MSNEKRAPGWLGYIGDYTTQFYRDYKDFKLFGSWKFFQTLRLFQHTELEHTPSNLYQQATFSRFLNHNWRCRGLPKGVQFSWTNIPPKKIIQKAKVFSNVSTDLFGWFFPIDSGPRSLIPSGAPEVAS